MNDIESCARVISGMTDYPIFIGGDKFAMLGDMISSGKKVMVVTDDNVAPLYLDEFENGLSKAADVKIFSHIIRAGEESKTPYVYLEIIDDLAKNFFRRDDVVIALGGGVVGDIAGFAAATYLRGIDFYQVPTTLLAMIDSSIGGKTGVDLQYGKNLLGSFYDPRAVLIDVDYLNSLPAEQWKNGFGESVKYACLMGGDVYSCLTGAKGDGIPFETLIGLCAEYKARTVAADRLEHDGRRLLNFGHTIGHAIERASDFKVSHGVAVAQGIRVMALAAHEAGELDDDSLCRLLCLLDSFGFDNMGCDFDKLLEFIDIDKKTAVGDSIYAVKFYGFGDCRVQKMPVCEFKKYVATALDSRK